VQFVTCVVNRENLAALATFLESGDVEVVIDKTYPLSETEKAVAHMLGHHARGKIAITVSNHERNEDTRARQLMATKEAS
jgi:NADPH:quinone reductase-like Zn-dependent oxidoreductase